MMRELLLTQLKAVAQSVTSLFELCPLDQLDSRPAEHMRSVLELGNHFAATPLVDLAILQESPGPVVEAIEETLHGAGPGDWIEIFSRGVQAMDEYFERMPVEEFAERESRAYYGTSYPQCGWLLEAVNHIYHHRGQFYVYLKMIGVSVDVEHLYT